MFPMVLDVGAIKVALVGEGGAVERRLELLDAAGIVNLEVYSVAPGPALIKAAGARLKGAWPLDAALKAARIVFSAGLGESEAEGLADAVHAAGGLINTEDRKALCDFHVPSTIRRGDLLLTVSTGGKSPGLAKRLRRHIEGLFGPEWSDRLDELARRRDEWRKEGLELSDLGRRTDEYVEERGWLE